MKNSVGAFYYMRYVQEMLQEQMRLALGPNDLMFRPEEVGGMDWSWKRHTMRRKYLWGVYSAVRKEVIQNVS